MAIATAFALLAVVTAFAASGDTVADRVFGHTGSFTVGNCNAGGVLASTLCSPRGMALDSSGRLYVADYTNNRVLEYDNPLSCTPTSPGLCDANHVYGQGGNFTTNSCPGPPSAASLCGPTGVAVDGTGHLYVADSLNCRVLEYDSAPTNQTANRVFGELDFSTNSNRFSLGISSTSLGSVDGVAVDSTGLGHLYVADNSHHRVLEYDNPLGCTPTPCTANRVFGQPSMMSGGCNFEGSPATGRTLCNPRGVSTDGLGHVYIADENNARVLEFDNQPGSSDPYADRIFGQLGSPTTNNCDKGSPGPTASTLCTPTGVGVDNLGRLYVADGGIGAGDSHSSRVLEYDHPRACTPAPPTPCDGGPAQGVFGQFGSFTTATCNQGGSISADTLCVPNSVATDGSRDVYISDIGANRVLEYNSPLDSDGDGCPDNRELSGDWRTGGQRSASDPWDFFDVPVPALLPSNAMGTRDNVIRLDDVLAILTYVGTSLANSNVANANGAKYGTDLNMNGVPDGQEYDRTASSTTGQPWRSNAPDGAVSLGDALVALKQVGTNCR